jgi:hypothetical protein
MNNQITSKIAALGVALLMNSFLLGGVAYLFNNAAQQGTQTLSLAANGAPLQSLAPSRISEV